MWHKKPVYYFGIIIIANILKNLQIVLNPQMFYEFIGFFRINSCISITTHIKKKLLYSKEALNVTDVTKK